MPVNKEKYYYNKFKQIRFSPVNQNVTLHDLDMKINNLYHIFIITDYKFLV